MTSEKNDIFKTYYKKSFHRCSIAVRVLTVPPFVNKPIHVWKNSSDYQDVYEDGMEIKMLKIIGNSLNLSLAIEPDVEETYRKSLPAIYVGGYKMLPSMKIASIESLRNYLTIHSAWYTPCALKYPKLGRFFNIFSVHMWICLLSHWSWLSLQSGAFQTTHTKHTCTNPILTATFLVS